MGDLVSYYHERPYKMEKYKNERRENGDEQGRSLECFVFPHLDVP